MKFREPPPEVDIDYANSLLLNGGGCFMFPADGEPFTLLLASVSRIRDPEYSPLFMPDPKSGDRRPGKYFRKNYQRWTFEYVLEKSGTLELDGMSYKIEPGDIYVLPEGHTHLYYPEKKYWIKQFFVCAGSIVSGLVHAYGLGGCVVFPHCRELRKYFEKFDRLYSEKKADMNDSASLLFHELLIKLASKIPEKENRELVSLRRVRHELDNSLHTKLNLGEFAARFDISASQLTRLFKKWFDTTPYEYFLAKKIELAGSMLALGNGSMAEIASQLAFSDSFHLSKEFVKRFGVSPTAYRKKFQGQNRVLPVKKEP